MWHCRVVCKKKKILYEDLPSDRTGKDAVLGQGRWRSQIVSGSPECSPPLGSLMFLPQRDKQKNKQIRRKGCDFQNKLQAKKQLKRFVFLWSVLWKLFLFVSAQQKTKQQVIKLLTSSDPHPPKNIKKTQNTQKR